MWKNSSITLVFPAPVAASKKVLSPLTRLTTVLIWMSFGSCLAYFSWNFEATAIFDHWCSSSEAFWSDLVVQAEVFLNFPSRSHSQSPVHSRVHCSGFVCWRWTLKVWKIWLASRSTALRNEFSFDSVDYKALVYSGARSYLMGFQESLETSTISTSQIWFKCYILFSLHPQSLLKSEKWIFWA